MKPPAAETLDRDDPRERLHLLHAAKDGGWLDGRRKSGHPAFRGAAIRTYAGIFASNSERESSSSSVRWDSSSSATKRSCSRDAQANLDAPAGVSRV